MGSMSDKKEGCGLEPATRPLNPMRGAGEGHQLGGASPGQRDSGGDLRWNHSLTHSFVQRGAHQVTLGEGGGSLPPAKTHVPTRWREWGCAALGALLPTLRAPHSCGSSHFKTQHSIPAPGPSATEMFYSESYVFVEKNNRIKHADTSS